ncbi:hypothetical protein NE848_14140 [Gramella jeungdoensis]|uniref:Uncharacterized protein n=1 Tax=Gramella jeungdoensis TaxID=708091 RepID=A0ABT0Z462_9FLAO|nr:hypothetical protein [Gramella jeungdoensis]MCM8570531.1 hypothetical protein [Gramella jeungdoensis]
MKKLKISMSLLAIFALLLTSCSKEETASPLDDPNVQSSVDLTFGAMLNDLSNRAMATNKTHFGTIPDCSDTEPAYVVLEISYDGQAPETEGPITVDILSDGDDYFTAFSELLKVPVADGSFVTVTLNSFRVFDSGDNVIWVAPKESDGNFDGYVDSALPISFDVEDGTKPYIDVEVLCFDRRMVNEYGYPFFDLIPGKLYPLCFFANFCPSPDGRHYVANYSIDLYYDDGDSRIQLYPNPEDDAQAVTDDSNNSADPVCLVVPESPFEDPTIDYLFYVITPLDWPNNYGDIDNTPMAEVGLNWNEVEALLNDDGETNEYLHIFIGCDDTPPPPDDCPLPAEEDSDGDCVPNDDDICPGHDDNMHSDGDTIPDGCDNCPWDSNQDQLDTDGDDMGDVCDTCPFVAPENDNDGDCKPNDDDPCPNDSKDNCDDVEEGACGTAFMFSPDNILINAVTNSNRWGWIELYDVDDSIIRDIYVGAGQNDLDKGTHIGSVTISRDGDNLNFDFELLGDYEFSTLHIHVADTEEEAYSVAKSPGRYNQNGILDGLGDQSLDILGDLDDDLWIIVHADACDE